MSTATMGLVDAAMVAVGGARQALLRQTWNWARAAARVWSLWTHRALRIWASDLPRPIVIMFWLNWVFMAQVVIFV